jgi:hypothetical protein
MHKFSLLPRDFDPSQASLAVAHISIKPRFTLGETSAKIGLLNGIVMAPTERFDEYPAFSGEALSFEISLLGPPTAEVDLRKNPTDWFQLQILPSPKSGGAMLTLDIFRYLAGELTSFLGIECRGLDRGGAKPSGADVQK